jgi:hypothetical protein
MSPITLYNAQQAKTVIDELWRAAKAQLMAGQRMVIELKEATRSNEASAKFHAMCGDFAKSGVQWAGKKRTAIEWKVLLISGHSVATKEGAEMVPGLENEFVNIRESSARMGTRRMNSLIEYTYAHGVQLGVRFSAPEDLH